MSLVEQSYDRMAAAYAEQYFDELDDKPFDRLMLDWLVARTPSGRLCDLGCGPGQIAAYLDAKGSDVCGIDLSARLLEQARRRVPTVTFHVGNMLRLDAVADASFAGIAAFYAIVNLSIDQLKTAFAEMHRVLVPGGTMVLSFHVGNETRHFDELLGEPVDLDFSLFEPEQVADVLREAGLTVTEVLQRAPYLHKEVPTQRAYVWCTKVAG